MIDKLPSLKDKIAAEKAALQAELEAVEQEEKRAKKITKAKH